MAVVTIVNPRIARVQEIARSLGFDLSDSEAGEYIHLNDSEIEQALKLVRQISEISEPG